VSGRACRFRRWVFAISILVVDPAPGRSGRPLFGTIAGLSEAIGVGAGFDDGAAEGEPIDDRGAQPGVGEGSRASKLDAFKPVIDSFLRADLDAPRKTPAAGTSYVAPATPTPARHRPPGHAAFALGSLDQTSPLAHHGGSPHTAQPSTINRIKMIK
jgi:hypothetical protein